MEKEACSLLKTLLPHCSEETKDILPLSFENSIFSLVSVVYFRTAVYGDLWTEAGN